MGLGYRRTGKRAKKQTLRLLIAVATAISMAPTVLAAEAINSFALSPEQLFSTTVIYASRTTNTAAGASRQVAAVREADTDAHATRIQPSLYGKFTWRF